MSDIHQNWLPKHPNNTQCSKRILNGRHLSEPISKKCPNSTSPSKEKVAGCTPVDLLSLGACQLVQRHLSIPPRKSTGWQPVPSRGETRRILKTNGYRQLLGTYPQTSSRGQLAVSSGSMKPSCRIIMVAALPGEDSGSQILQEHNFTGH